MIDKTIVCCLGKDFISSILYWYHALITLILVVFIPAFYVGGYRRNANLSRMYSHFQCTAITGVSKMF